MVSDRGGVGKVLELGSPAALASYLDTSGAQREGYRVLLEVEDSVGEAELRALCARTRSAS